MSIQYSPMAPVGGNDPAQYSYKEFLDLSKALREAQANIPLQVLNVVPTKPRTGMIVYADGTNWDPGAGAGVYGYINGGWVPLHTGGAGSGANLSYTAATRVIASDTGTDATLPLVSTGDAGLAPASGGGTSNFLRADGTWTAPTAVVGDGDKGDISITGGVWNLDLTLDAIDAPVASVNFADQQALSFRLENRTSDPGTPTTGQMWLRTDI